MLSLQIYRRILFMKPTCFLCYDIMFIDIMNYDYDVPLKLWILFSPVIMALILNFSPVLSWTYIFQRVILSHDIIVHTFYPVISCVVKRYNLYLDYLFLFSIRDATWQLHWLREVGVSEQEKI